MDSYYNLAQQNIYQGRYLVQVSASNSTNSTDIISWDEIWNYFKEGSEKSCDLLGKFNLRCQKQNWILNTLLCLIVSAILAYLIFLLVKRSIEKPKRTWKIFLMDTSKQIFSSGLLHVYNLIASELLSSGESMECQWYFILFSIDVFGIALFSYLFLHLSVRCMRRTCGYEINLGSYDLKKEHEDSFSFNQDDDRSQQSAFMSSDDSDSELERSQVDRQYNVQNSRPTKIWLIQLIHWLVIISLSKLCILGIILLFKEQLLYLGVLALYPIQQYPRLLLLVVMVLIPVGFNALQFWILDEFLRSKETHHEFLKHQEDIRRQTMENNKKPAYFSQQKRNAYLEETSDLSDLLSIDNEEQQQQRLIDTLELDSTQVQD
eukprot:403335956